MVAKLITTSSTGEETEFELVNETTTIGRKPGNDIQIDNLSVSGRHAQVITILEDSFLEDLGSTNGTYVNGKLVKKHALENGDNITLGKYQIIYQR
jgi:pSer/pThr/pTyr-binding forkhead associated (FHA) protein